MLSRTAAHLYWIGRYMERAEFATRLIEATIRLAALRDHEESEQAWRSALSVVGAASSFRATGETHNPANVRRYLTLAEDNASSVRSCLATARDNARAARTALTVEVWEAINRAWLIIRDRTKPGGVQQSLNLMDSLKAEIRGFEGALRRMPRSLAASAEETVDLLSAFANRSGRQGPADRLARKRLDRIQSLKIEEVVRSGLHEWLHTYIRDNAALDQAIARQFRFG